MRITRITTALLATAAAGVFLAGCGGASEHAYDATSGSVVAAQGAGELPAVTSTQPSNLGVGRTIRQTHISPDGVTSNGTGVLTVWSAEWTTTGLTLDVSVDGVTGTVAIQQSDLDARDAQGHTYPIDCTFGPLTAGETARSSVTVAAPQGPLTVGTGRDVRWVIPAA